MGRSFAFSFAILGLTTAGAFARPIGIDLGAASSFAVLAGSTVTNSGATTIHGDLGVSPGTAITRFLPGLVVSGAVHGADAVAAQAQTDLTAAYSAAAGAPAGTTLTGQDLGGLTLSPGTYTFANSAQLTGVLTLDAGGDPLAAFLFQIGSTLVTAGSSSVLLTNGGQAGNVNFQVGSSATLGASSAFTGNILALTSISLDTGAVIQSGRALARNGAVTLLANDISAPMAATPSASVPEPATATLAGMGVLLTMAARRRPGPQAAQSRAVR